MPSRTALLRLYYFVFFGAIGAYVPYFPMWLRARGITGLAMSSIMVLNPLFGISSPLLFGYVADRFGLRGSLLRVAAVGTLVPIAVITWLGMRGANLDYATLFGLVAFFAFFRGPMVSMADVAALEDRASYGRTRLFGSAGFLIVAWAAGRLFDPTDTAALPLTITVSLVLTFFVTLAIPGRAARPPANLREEAARLLRSRDYALFLAAGTLWFASGVAYDLCFSMHLRDIGATPAYVGASWAVGVLAEIALMANAERLFARHTTARLLTVGLATAVFRYLLISWIRSLPVLFLLQPLHAITFALFWTTAQEHVKQRAPAGILATAQSLFYVATALGSGFGMLVWGPLYSAASGSAVFAGAAAVAAAGTAVTLALAGAVAPARAAGPE